MKDGKRQSLNLQLHFINFPYLEEIQSVQTSRVCKDKLMKAGEALRKETEYLKMLGPYHNIFVMVDDSGLYAKTSPKCDLTYEGKGFPGALIKDFIKSVEGDFCEGICKQFGGSSAIAEVSIGIYNIITDIDDVVTKMDYGYIPVEPKHNKEKENFGWDPCFVPNKIGQDDNTKNESYDMIPTSIKNQYSMRSKAISAAFDLVCSYLS